MDRARGLRWVVATVLALVWVVAPAQAQDPHLEQGFPVRAFFASGTYQSGAGNAVVTGQLDADPELEILGSSTAAGPLFAWEADGTPQPGWPNEGTGAAYAALGELSRRSPGLEVVLITWGRIESHARVEARTGDGELLPGWPRGAASYGNSPPTLADVDGDGLDEVFVNLGHGDVHAFRQDGSDLPGWPRHNGTADREVTPAAVDVTGDGLPELLTASGGYVTARRRDGSAVWGPTLVATQPNDDTGPPAAGDVDGDGALEVVAVTGDQVVVLSRTGAVERRIAAQDGPLALGDLTGDGVPEIVVQGEDAVQAWRGTGAAAPGWPVSLAGRWRINSGPVIGDVDGDGAADVVVTSTVAGSATGGDVRAWSGGGTLLAGFPKTPPFGTGDLSPALADVDRDGRHELLVAGFESGYGGRNPFLWAYDLGGAGGGPVPWGQYAGGPRHQGRLGQPAGVPAPPPAGTGSAAPAQLVRDIAGGAAGSDPGEPATLGSALIFAADDGAGGREPWRSDGTAAATSRLRDVRPGPLGSRPRGFTALGGALLFSADDGASGRELWRTDGTAAGTTRLADIWPGAGSSDPQGFTVVGGVAYFSAWDGEHGHELWRTDGTAAGTRMVRDLVVGLGLSAHGAGEGSDPTLLTALGSTLVLRASWIDRENETSGGALLRSDGTAAGTRTLGDRYIAEFSAPWAPGSMVALGQRVVFHDGVLLGVSDGTDAGTRVLIERALQRIGPLTPLGDRVVFPADGFDGTGLELWSLDPDATEPVRVRDLVPGPGSGAPALLTPHGGALLLRAADSRGHELWRTDGTAAGTAMVADVRPSGRSSAPAHLEPVGGEVVFTADDGVRGQELWRTDGTPRGTAPLADVAPGPRGSAITWVHRAGDRVFFAADDGAHGHELWSVPAPLPARPRSVAPPWDFDGDGRPDLAAGAPGEDDGRGAVVVRLGRGSTQSWTQDSAGVPDAGEPGDGFGTALASGDLDRDGFADLAVGAPGEDIGTRADAGVVHVLFGGPGGLSTTGTALVHQAGPRSGGADEAGDRFGSALAVAPLGGGPEDDLAVGAPGEDVGSIDGAGAVVAFAGGPGGLGATPLLARTQDSSGEPDAAEAGDAFGSALAAASFDGAGVADLAVGVPGEDSAGRADIGGVHVLGAGMWFQGSIPGMGGSEPGDRLGAALAAADLDGDGRAELVAGAPGEDLGAAQDAGAVGVLPGGAGGLTGEGARTWHQDVADVQDTAEDGDRFGAALVAGDLARGAEGDLAVGVPGEDAGAGAAAVLFGAPGGLGAAEDQLVALGVLGLPEAPKAGDGFGTAVGRAGRALVAGVPGRVSGAGGVAVLQGAAVGLGGTAGARLLVPGRDLPGTAEAGDRVGAAVSSPR